MSIVVDDELVVGRNAEGAGRLAEDGELSRSHARIAIDGNGFCAVEDLGSTNGTFVNGLRITTPQTLSAGDTIELGGTTLVVRDIPTRTQDTARSGVVQLSSPAPPVEEPAVTPPEPASAVAAAPAPPSGSLSLRLEVDFSTQEVWLRVDDASEPLLLVCEDGVWRAAEDAATRERDSG
jgi:pSer/pThr/pTyr-binding forkhead associated (FHA) protein